ncbi:2Fe-2S iron-sulfur cluster-binding protein [bacterium]|nr:2Fe-2S iron-sulfur cluster-binding protein [bacterium]
MNKIKIYFDNQVYEVRDNTNVLEASKSVGVFIPSWCAIKNKKGSQVCRLCIVEIEGIKGAVSSCMMDVKDGMKVNVNQMILNKTRKTTLELLLQEHKGCSNSSCELEALGEKLGVDPSIENLHQGSKTKRLSDYLSYNASLCIHCERCINTCDQQNALIAERKTRNIDLKNEDSKNPCIECGDCIFACKAGALTENKGEAVEL